MVFSGGVTCGRREGTVLVHWVSSLIGEGFELILEAEAAAELVKFASRYLQLESSSYMWSSSLSLDSSSFESSFSFKFVPAVPTVPSPGARAMLSRRSCDPLWG